MKLKKKKNSKKKKFKNLNKKKLISLLQSSIYLISIKFKKNNNE